MAVVDDSLMVGRVYDAAACLGALKRCAQLMTRYASRRTVATGRLLDNSVTLAKTGDLAATIAVVEALVDQVAEKLDAGAVVPIEAALAAKIVATESLNRASVDLVQLLSGRGYIENNLALQILRDARALSVGDGPNEALGLFVGRSASSAETIARFLSGRWRAPGLASRVSDAARRIERDFLGRAATFSDRSAALCWAHALAVRGATDAILLAALRAARCDGTGRAPFFPDWARSRFERTLDHAFHEASGERTIPRTPEIEGLVTAYSAAIGDVEQSLPGEEEALEPTFRRPHRGTNRAIRRAPGEPRQRPSVSGTAPPSALRVTVPDDARGQARFSGTCPAIRPDPAEGGRLRPPVADPIVWPLKRSTMKSVAELRSKGALEAWLVSWLADELGLPPGEIKPAETFLNYGMNSLQAMMLVGDLERSPRPLAPPSGLGPPQHRGPRPSRRRAECGRASPIRGARDSANGAPRVSPREAEDSLARLDQLSDEGVDGLLASLRPGLAKGSHSADAGHGPHLALARREARTARAHPVRR